MIPITPFFTTCCFCFKVKSGIKQILWSTAINFTILMIIVLALLIFVNPGPAVKSQMLIALNMMDTAKKSVSTTIEETVKNKTDDEIDEAKKKAGRIEVPGGKAEDEAKKKTEEEARKKEHDIVNENNDSSILHEYLDSVATQFVDVYDLILIIVLIYCIIINATHYLALVGYYIKKALLIAPVVIWRFLEIIFLLILVLYLLIQYSNLVKDAEEAEPDVKNDRQLANEGKFRDLTNELKKLFEKYGFLTGVFIMLIDGVGIPSWIFLFPIFIPILLLITQLYMAIVVLFGFIMIYNEEAGAKRAANPYGPPPDTGRVSINNESVPQVIESPDDESSSSSSSTSSSSSSSS